MENIAAEFKSICACILNKHATLASHLIKDGTELEKLQERATCMVRNKD